MVKFILNDLLRQIYGHMKVYYPARKVIKKYQNCFRGPVGELAGLVSHTTSKTTNLSKIKVARINTSQV